MFHVKHKDADSLDGQVSAPYYLRRCLGTARSLRSWTWYIRQTRRAGTH